MIIPGELIALLTFPGVIVHEAAHQIFCRLFRVAIFDVRYLRFGNPVGFVQHEAPAFPNHQLWIAIGPFLVNTVLGAIIAAPAAIAVFDFGSGDALDALLIWLGVSIAMHAFPSIGDARTILHTLRTRKTSLPTKLVGIPIFALIYIGASASMIWLDVIYGAVVAMLLPRTLISILA